MYWILYIFAGTPTHFDLGNLVTLTKYVVMKVKTSKVWKQVESPARLLFWFDSLERAEIFDKQRVKMPVKTINENTENDFKHVPVKKKPFTIVVEGMSIKIGFIVKLIYVGTYVIVLLFREHWFRKDNISRILQPNRTRSCHGVNRTRWYALFFFIFIFSIISMYSFEICIFIWNTHKQTE